MAAARKATAKRGGAAPARKRAAPRAEPESTLRWYRARQAVYDEAGRVIRAGGLILAEPSDPRVLSGQVKLLPDREPTPAEIAAALAAAER